MKNADLKTARFHLTQSEWLLTQKQMKTKGIDNLKGREEKGIYQ